MAKDLNTELLRDKSKYSGQKKGENLMFKFLSELIPKAEIWKVDIAILKFYFSTTFTLKANMSKFHHQVYLQIRTCITRDWKRKGFGSV